MKRSILGFTAIILAVAASAFTIPKTTKATGKFANLKWYSISGSLATNAPVARANATYLGQFASAPTQSGCGTTQTKQCISGFDAASQVDPTTNQLIDDSQVPMDAHYRRN